MLRYLKADKHFAAPKATAPWIDQAKTYFLDAAASHWRSAGLLYYYSFLNLAKTFLVAKKRFSYKSLDKTSAHHGLRAQPQPVSELASYTVEIYPPSLRNRDNVFSHFYETLTGETWPFKDKVPIEVKNIFGYCSEIAYETSKLSRVEQKIVPAQSLIRQEKNQIWFEMLIPASQANEVKSHLVDWPLDAIEKNQFSEADRIDWLTSVRRTAMGLTDRICLRGPKRQYTADDQHFSEVANEALLHLAPYAVPTAYILKDWEYWLFIPRIQLLGKKLKWHPLLSEYLVAFVLSTILRYQPQLLKPGSLSHFVAEAWCAQSASTALRYFLMLLTHPPKRIESY